MADSSNHNDDRSNTLMSGPAMRPATSRLQPRPTPDQLKAQQQATERAHQLTQQMAASIQRRQNWATQPRKMQRIENTLSNNPELRNSLFTLYKGGNTPFVSLDPKTQLRVVKQVNGHLKTMARTLAAGAAAQSLIPDPTDPLNPVNQANPYNIANQQQAAWQANILTQDNQVAQTIQAEDNEQFSIQQQQTTEQENNEAEIELTEAEVTEIAAHNTETYNASPTPSPENTSTDKKESDETEEGKKILEHAGEERALQAYRSEDKAGMIEGFKGAKTAVEHTVVHEALQVGLSMLSGS